MFGLEYNYFYTMVISLVEPESRMVLSLDMNGNGCICLEKKMGLFYFVVIFFKFIFAMGDYVTGTIQ